MTINSLTSSESTRFNEIQNYWINFEAISNENFCIQNYLYSVPLGQDFAGQFNINTGSVFTQSGSITVVKDVHLFDTEAEASNFIAEIGIDNISSYKEVVINDVTWFEIHMINFPAIHFQNRNLDAFNKLGFKIEIFLSSSEGLAPANKTPEFNETDELLNDTYLKYFSIETENNG